MPSHVLETLAESLSARFRRAINGARILIVGAAYKRNVDDLRESPALQIMEMLLDRGADVAFHDSYCLEIPPTREHARLRGMKSVEFCERVVSQFDAAVVITDHDNLDYDALVRWSALVIDTRNATKNVHHRRDIVVRA
jgi:UDP-N-acetyl-D-glucosamine dehydrogenase